MRCPEFTEIMDLVEGRLENGLRKKVETHLKDCAECGEKKLWAERSLQAMKSKTTVYDAPEYAVQKAIALFPEKKAGIAEWILAKLDFDSWSAPAAMGVRSEDRAPRQCVFTTEAYRVHLMLEPEGKRGKVVGQVVANSPSADPRDCLVELTDTRKVLDQTITSAQGEFLFSAPRNKQLQLRIHGDAESILISCKL